MREFFDADEAAVELQRLTKLEWTAAQVLREAENGNLPICFQHQGKIGVFNRQESELGQSIFGKALRTMYLPRGSYLRVQGHPMLTDVHQKQDSLHTRNLELVKLARTLLKSMLRHQKRCESFANLVALKILLQRCCRCQALHGFFTLMT